MTRFRVNEWNDVSPDSALVESAVGAGIRRPMDSLWVYLGLAKISPGGQFSVMCEPCSQGKVRVLGMEPHLYEYQKVEETTGLVEEQGEVLIWMQQCEVCGTVYWAKGVKGEDQDRRRIRA